MESNIPKQEDLGYCPICLAVRLVLLDSRHLGQSSCLGCILATHCRASRQVTKASHSPKVENNMSGGFEDCHDKSDGHRPSEPGLWLGIPPVLLDKYKDGC